MKRFGFLLIIILMPFTSFAGGEKDDVFEFTHNRLSFSGLLTSSDAYELEASYHYMFNRYVGVGGAIGYWQVYYVDGGASGNDWDIDSDYNKPSNLYLRPTLVLKSPALRIKSADVGIYAEPGFMMNIPYARVCIHQFTNWPDYVYKYVSTSQGQWFAMDLRVGVYANVGPLGFSAGYVMSNLDVYSRYRHLSYKNVSFREFYPEKSFMQGAYLTLSYYF